MAYNLQPLITILEGILDPQQTRWIVAESNPQLQSLLDKATSLQQLSELRNLKVYVFELLKDEEMNNSVLKKLQMISTTIVTKASTRDGFFKSIPNIKKLAIGDDFRSTTMEVDLSYLHRLKTLTCNFIRTPDDGDAFESDEETCDEEWEVADGDVFCSLQFLRLEHLSLCKESDVGCNAASCPYMEEAAR
ncbi:hypothetical protein SASPL_113696 [Salvia splendens]|uniref:Uncharacterized protein n=1 Tax=Salvia splendens TaxID=180675 RepID=A0A8X8Y221_SALSN|nr:hypothetical protein SASPL_113696 [Salvia splendens]